MELEIIHLREVAIREFDEFGPARYTHMDCNLEMILLLTDEGIIRRREVESLVSVYAVVNRWAENKTAW